MHLRFGNCLLDPGGRALIRGDEAVHVEPKVLDLLLLLAENRQRVVSKDELMEALWPDAVVGDAALSRLVKEARRAVGDTGSQQVVIKTYHGRGFRFVATTAPLAGASPALVQPVPADDSTAHAQTSACSEQGRRRALGILWIFPEPARPSFPGEQRMILGRAQGCGTVLAGKDVSRRHAEFFADGPLTILRDLSSRNGTYVNGRRITQAPLCTGDVVRLGEWVGVVAMRSASVPEHAKGLHAVAPGFFAGARFHSKLLALKSAAENQGPVTLQGPTGTGKSTLARVFYGWIRKRGSLITVRCEARDADFSLERELRAQLGQAAPGASTIVLDSVVELGPKAQGELVRLIDEQRVQRPDGAPPQSVRFLATTEGPLQANVSQGTFRSDLRARLSALVFEVPPLRERVEEIPALFVELLRKHSGGATPGVEPRLVERLCLYDWPFNVRELEQVARQLLLSHEQEPMLRASFLSPLLKDDGSSRLGASG